MCRYWKTALIRTTNEYRVKRAIVEQEYKIVERILENKFAVIRYWFTL